jgi:2-polyprenyl-3-methyl-5-hydroxy-6-metoxy-1,4-benzoquinol methylase
VTSHEFDQTYWDEHYPQAGSAAGHQLPPNPYLVREVTDLTPGTALEAGCGEGAEAIWLGLAGWQVTAVDIAAEPLARAAERATFRCVGDRVEWVRADLGSWEPARTYDLVTTHYAHPSIPQLELYDRLSAGLSAGEHTRSVEGAERGHRTLRDVVVRAVRRGARPTT